MSQPILRTSFAGALIALVLGCQAQPSQSSSATPTPSGSSATAGTRVEVMLMDGGAARSGVGVLPVLVLMSSKLQFGNAPVLYEERYHSHVWFEDAEGERVGFKIASVDAPDDGYFANASVTPVVPLRDDSWYSLVVLSDATFGVSGVPNGVRTQVPLFTGSAPFVASLQLAKGNVRVQMSEPVDLSTVPSKALALSSGGHAVTSCLVYNGNCVSQVPAGTWVNALDVLAQDAVAPLDVAVDLGAARSPSRTAAEGAGVSQVPVALGIDAAEWETCQEKAWCWNATTPLGSAGGK